MTLFLISFAVISLAVLAMAVGVLLGGHAIRGSCGGLNTIEGLEESCVACPSPCEPPWPKISTERRGAPALRNKCPI